MLDVNYILTTIGFLGVIAIIFAETGLFLGFFLPGDSLLLTAGFLASQQIFNLWTLLIAVPIAAILGYMLGYWFGGHLGAWLLKQPDTWYFKRSYYDKSRDFFDQHGGKALIFARMMPIIRTFVPIVAGVGKMPWPRYMLYNVLGAVIWGMGLPLLGYFLGQSIPEANKYILPITVVLVILSLIPTVWHYLRGRQ